MDRKVFLFLWEANSDGGNGGEMQLPDIYPDSDEERNGRLKSGDFV